MYREDQDRPGLGFTIVELMIVVAIIAIVVSIAIPSLAEARKSANESAAIGTLKTLFSSVESYRVKFGAIPDFDDLVAAGYLDSQALGMSSGVPSRQGYRVSLTLTSSSRYWVLCAPLTSEDGNRSFAYSMDPTVPLQTGMLLAQNEPGGP